MKTVAMKNTLTVNLLGAAALAFISLQTQAAVIGDVAISPTDGALGYIDTVNTKVGFFCADTDVCTEPFTARITQADGIFESIKYTSVAMYDFNYDDDTASDYILGHTLWTAGEFSMRIDSIERVEVGGAARYVTAGGFATFFQDDVALDLLGEWSLSLDGTNVVNFSSTATAYQVPEPGTMALLSIGLIGIGAARRSAARQS